MKSRTFSESVIQHINTGIVVLNRYGGVLVYNDCAKKMLPNGVPKDLYLPDTLTLCPLERQPLVRAMEGEYISAEEYFIKSTGASVLVNASPIFREDGTHTVGSTAVFFDITERKTLEAQVQHDALHDKLTGLPNRALLFHRLQEAIEREKRDPNYTFALLFADCDKLKKVNDELGHAAGDELLMTIAQRFTHNIRSVDLAARLGGDEFVILLSDIKLKPLYQKLNRLQKDLNAPYVLKDGTVSSTVSIGVTLSRSDMLDADTYINEADKAMYEAKKSRTGEYRFYSLEEDI